VSRAAVPPLLTVSVNVRELSTDHEVALNSVTTTADDVAVTVGADVFNRITTALDRATAAAESDSGHCNGHSITRFVLSLTSKTNSSVVSHLDDNSSHINDALKPLRLGQ